MAAHTEKKYKELSTSESGATFVINFHLPEGNPEKSISINQDKGDSVVCLYYNFQTGKRDSYWFSKTIKVFTSNPNRYVVMKCNYVTYSQGDYVTGNNIFFSGRDRFEAHLTREQMIYLGPGPLNWKYTWNSPLIYNSDYYVPVINYFNDMPYYDTDVANYNNNTIAINQIKSYFSTLQNSLTEYTKGTPLTQAQYDALTTKENKLYFIKES